MSIIYRYIAIVAMCSFLGYSQGECQVSNKEEITWDDIEGISVLPGNGTQISTVPQSTAPIFSEKEERMVVPESAIPEIVAKEYPSQPVPSESGPAQEEAASGLSQAKKTSPQLSAQQAVASETKPEPVTKKSSSPKKRRKAPETKWQRADAITSQEPGFNRDVSITNPERE